MEYTITKQAYAIVIEANQHAAWIRSGCFGSLTLEESPVCTLRLENLPSGEQTVVTSGSHWGKVRVRQYGDTLKLTLEEPEGIADIAVFVTATADENGIDWQVSLWNHNPAVSVTEAAYPTAQVSGDRIDLFVPENAGRHVQDVGKRPFHSTLAYPGIQAAMGYYACWNDHGGLYLGTHDDAGSMRTYEVHTGEDKASFQCTYPAIGAGRGGNCFQLNGSMRWAFFTGDWYDATMLYAAFVWDRAKWLPQIDENGRPDTPQRYKEIPFWIVDYIPNSPAQRDARPMVLGTVSQLYGPDYWFEAPIELQKKLGVPVAYHVYNWHEIPFNINYPHYTPAKAEYYRGLEKLRETDILLFPYINAVSWEEKDADQGFAVNFENTGRCGAVVMPDGDFHRTLYPQLKEDGEKTHLMATCPGFTKWHSIIKDEVRTIEATMEVDGIYFDQIAATSPTPCRSEHHGHIPGGGSHWVEGYNRMMDYINTDKPDDAFYFTECNGEPYMNRFDGYLTWLWQNGDGVPAFPAIYAGYIQMIGRCTDGRFREDDVYYRFHLAQSLLYGQQTGWINAAVVYNEKRYAFLERIVQTRYSYTKVFNSGILLRPPMVETDVPAVESSGIVMQQVLCGAWQMRNGTKTVVFLVNIGEDPAESTVRFDLAEYGLTAERLPEGWTVKGTMAEMTHVVAPLSVMVWEMEK